MREKILAQLKAKYSGVHKAVLELLATKLAAKVTEESQIEGAISDFETTSPVSVTDYAQLLQTEGDRRVTEALKKEPAKPDPTKADPAKAEKVPAENDLAAQLAAIAAQLNELKKEKAQGTATDQVHKKLADKKIPLSYVKGRVIDPERDIDEQVTEIENDYTAFKQELVNQGLSLQEPPVGGSGGSNPTAKQVEADIAAWAQKGKPAAATIGAAK
jgi:DNA-binding FrmR family transcriptional regulator